jgi:sporulation protein YabP
MYHSVLYAEVLFMQENGEKKIHWFYSENRDGIKIRGVSEVLSFDDGGVALATPLGNMAVEGEGLRVTTLNTDEGVVEITGKINGVYYYDARPTAKRGLFSRRSET